MSVVGGVSVFDKWPFLGNLVFSCRPALSRNPLCHLPDIHDRLEHHDEARRDNVFLSLASCEA